MPFTLDSEVRNSWQTFIMINFNPKVSYMETINSQDPNVVVSRVLDGSACSLKDLNRVPWVVELQFEPIKCTWLKWGTFRDTHTYILRGS